VSSDSFLADDAHPETVDAFTDDSAQPDVRRPRSALVPSSAAANSAMTRRHGREQRTLHQAHRRASRRRRAQRSYARASHAGERDQAERRS
jgi:hypothetical protein